MESLLAKQCRPGECWCQPLNDKESRNCQSSRGWDGYVGGLADAYYRYEDDWGFSFPGRLARFRPSALESYIDAAATTRTFRRHDLFVWLMMFRPRSPAGRSAS